MSSQKFCNNKKGENQGSSSEGANKEAKSYVLGFPLNCRLETLMNCLSLYSVISKLVTFGFHQFFNDLYLFFSYILCLVVHTHVKCCCQKPQCH